MNLKERINILNKLAAASGVVSRLVETALGIKPKEKPKFKTLGSAGPGTTILMSENCVKPDGSVDIVINFRGIMGVPESAASLGVNAVVVACEAGGKGSKELVEQFGYPDRINEIVSTVLGHLKSQFPDKNVRLGRLAVAGFSGGGAPVARAIANRKQIRYPIYAAIINDGLHVDPKNKEIYDSFKDFVDEGGKLTVAHTAVETSYTSTTQSAEELKKRFRMTKHTGAGADNWVGNFIPPDVSTDETGRFKVFNLFDTPLPYTDKRGKPNQFDPETGEPITSGAQHIAALRNYDKLFEGILEEDNA